MLMRAFSGRPGRAIATAYVRAAAVKSNDIDRMQPWAGGFVHQLWQGAQSIHH